MTTSPAILCESVDSSPVPLVLSFRIGCDNCGAAVWLSTVADSLPDARRYCLPCMLLYRPESGKLVRELQTGRTTIEQLCERWIRAYQGLNLYTVTNGHIDDQHLVRIGRLCGQSRDLDGLQIVLALRALDEPGRRDVLERIATGR